MITFLKFWYCSRICFPSFALLFSYKYVNKNRWTETLLLLLFFYLYWVPKFCISFFCTKYWTGKRGSRSINSQCFCLYTVFKIGWDLLICGIGRGDCLPSNNLKFCTEYGIYPTISFIASFICMHIILLCWFSLVLIVRC
jgi:hypothetical protein